MKKPIRLPKSRISLDLDYELLRWVTEQVEKTGKSRNEVIADAITAYRMLRAKDHGGLIEDQKE